MKSSSSRLVKVVSVLVLIVGAAFAAPLSYPRAADVVDFPDPVGYVNDFANIIDDDSELESKLAALAESDSTQIMVITMDRLPENESIDDFVPRLTDGNPKWQAGAEQFDNGVFFTIVLETHDVAIDVGYGLEGALTDIRASLILENEVKPYFRDGNYTEGVNRGVDAIIAEVRGEYVASEDAEEETGSGWAVLIPIFVMIFFVFIFPAIMRKRGCSPVPGVVPFSPFGAPFSGRRSGSTFSGGRGISTGGFKAGGGSFGGGGSRSKW